MITPGTAQNQSSEMTRIAHYQIVRKIGQGGMSVVYEAMDERLKRPVALKVLHPFLADTKEYRARFYREAEAVARLNHPNILQIFDVASKNDQSSQLYLVTELLIGQTLKEFSAKNSLLELPELSAMIIWQIAQALEHAHNKGIIHRDIKPENIMVKSDGQIKLMDFGIASIGSDESLTQSGTLLGSLAHVAPEIIKGHKISVQSDIFSLSTVFYWLLTNKLPFESDSPHALLKSIVDTQPVKMQKLSPYILDEIALIVEKGMKKKSSERFSSVSKMSEAIESTLRAMGLEINSKKMAAALREPATQLAPFKKYLLQQIENKAKEYEKQKLETKALSLFCRLEDSKKRENNNKPTPHKNSHSKKLKILLATSFAIVLSTSAYLLLTQKSPSPVKTPIVNNLISKKKIKVIDPLLLLQSVDQSLTIKSIQEEASPPPAEEEVVKIETNKTPIVKKQLLDITIWPFANVYLDGKKVANNIKSLSLKLKEGSHHLAFTHTYAATLEARVDISATTPPKALKINLTKSKPAFLVIHSTVNADVAIGGKYKGPSKVTLSRPIVIPIPDRTHAVVNEVLIQKEGYKAQIHEIEFVAGRTSRLNIKLEPISKPKSRTLDAQIKPILKRLFL